MVRAKKHLGQHFLRDLDIAEKIVGLLDVQDGASIVELGPGEGVLTDFILGKTESLTLVEIDDESVAHLEMKYGKKGPRILNTDFLKVDFSDISKDDFNLIGNFPYNISSQIMFRVFENKDQVNQVVGMFQKEVAQRLTADPGTKNYGILSVLLQFYYDVAYCFDVPAHVFDPPPKVTSGVINIKRNDRKSLPLLDEKIKKIVKLAFGQRRKTLRNSLKSLLQDRALPEQFQMKRPEQLSCDEFLELCLFLEG